MIQRILNWLGRRQAAKHHVADTVRRVDDRMDRIATMVQQDAERAGITIALNYRTVNKAAFGRWPYTERRKGPDA